MLKLLAFRVQNYKSVTDSGICHLSKDGITVLAGKNESGKTTILEAVRDFLNGESFGEAARPINMQGRGDPTVWALLSCDESDLGAFEGDVGHAVPREIAKLLCTEGIWIGTSDDQDFVFDAEFSAKFKELFSAYSTHQHDEARDVIRLMEDSAVLASLIESVSTSDDIDHAILELREILPSLREAAQNAAPGAPRGSLIKLVERAEDACDTVSGDELEDALLSSLFRHSPKVVFFSDIQNLLPFEISLATASQHQAVADFAKLANLDLADLNSKTGLVRRNLLSLASADFTAQFGAGYAQEKVELRAEVDGATLRFVVTAQGRPEGYRPDQRSRGFQWFLSFFLRLCAASQKRSVILIDEPGLYLHARAQRDVLQVLESLVTQDDVQIVFSTHSPYLIRSSKLHRVRLVVRETGSGTVIPRSLVACSDPDTLTPVITAIDDDPAVALTRFSRPTVIVEGVSDVFYALAMGARMNGFAVDKVSFVGACGASNAPNIATILAGWGVPFVVALDGDSQGNAAIKQILRRECALESQICRMAGATEDLFDPHDFDNMVQTVFSDVPRRAKGDSNSTWIGKSGVSKVVLARTLAEGDFSSHMFSEATISRWAAYFELLTRALGAQECSAHESPRVETRGQSLRKS